MKWSIPISDGSPPTCGDSGCRVEYWRDVVSRGYRDADGRQVARDDKDARLALASAELVCRVFHAKEAGRLAGRKRK